MCLYGLERRFRAIQNRIHVVLGVPLAPRRVFLAKFPRVTLRGFRHSAIGGAGQKVRERLVLSSSARLARLTGRAARAGRAARVLAEDRPRDEPRDRERTGLEQQIGIYCGVPQSKALTKATIPRAARM